MSQTPYQMLRMEKRVAELLSNPNRTFDEAEELKLLEETLADRAKRENEQSQSKSPAV